MHQVEEIAMRIQLISAAYLIRIYYTHAIQEISVNLVSRHRLARPGTTVYGPQPHQDHQPADLGSIGGKSLFR